MQEETLFFIIITIISFEYLLTHILESLNKKKYTEKIPHALEGIYDKEKYTKARHYAFEKSKLNFYTSSLSFIVVIVFLFFGIFGEIDIWVSSYFTSATAQSLAFFALLGMGSMLMNLPFGIYFTFVIEQKYGFNTTTYKTFFLDKIKTLFLGGIIGGGLLYVFLFFHQLFPDTYWLFFWVVITLFSLLMIMFYATWIAPLFNKLTPLQEGELKDTIFNYCKTVKFPLKNVFVMDGSKRSKKANAYFSGLGKSRNIVLFDTLVENYSLQEIEAVLAHEVGHYKKKHTLQMLFLSTLSMLFFLFIMYIIVDTPSFSYILGSQTSKIHLGLVVFSFLFQPINIITGVFTNFLSRKNEYQADRYATETASGTALMDSLKKLSVDSLSNLTPHPAYILFYYSHPTLLNRIYAIKNVEKEQK